MKPSRQPAVRQAKYAGKHTINMPVDLVAFDAVIDGIERDVSAAIRPAAQAGAEVIYQAVLQNVQKIRSVTGNLRSSIYQAFSEDKSQVAGSGYARATYHISWNAKTAPHGHLIEWGHLQRYEYYKGNDGKVRPMVRPGLEFTKKPGRRASQAEKDAYYVPRIGGPKQVPAKPFIRPAFYKQGEAVAAMRAKFWEVLDAK
jgi:hypothetical protein